MKYWPDRKRSVNLVEELDWLCYCKPNTVYKSALRLLREVTKWWEKPTLCLLNNRSSSKLPQAFTSAQKQDARSSMTRTSMAEQLQAASLASLSTAWSVELSDVNYTASGHWSVLQTFVGLTHFTLSHFSIRQSDGWVYVWPSLGKLDFKRKGYWVKDVE